MQIAGNSNLLIRHSKRKEFWVKASCSENHWCAPNFDGSHNITHANRALQFFRLSREVPRSATKTDVAQTSGLEWITCRAHLRTLYGGQCFITVVSSSQRVKNGTMSYSNDGRVKFTFATWGKCTTTRYFQRTSGLGFFFAPPPLTSDYCNDLVGNRDKTRHRNLHLISTQYVDKRTLRIHIICVNGSRPVRMNRLRVTADDVQRCDNNIINIHFETLSFPERV